MASIVGWLPLGYLSSSVSRHGIYILKTLSLGYNFTCLFVLKFKIIWLCLKFKTIWLIENIALRLDLLKPHCNTHCFKFDFTGLLSGYFWWFTNNVNVHKRSLDLSSSTRSMAFTKKSVLHKSHKYYTRGIKLHCLWWNL